LVFGFWFWGFGVWGLGFGDLAFCRWSESLQPQKLQNLKTSKPLITLRAE